MKKIRIELDAGKIQQLLAIAIDDDREQALRFIKHIEKALQPH